MRCLFFLLLFASCSDDPCGHSVVVRVSCGSMVVVDTMGVSEVLDCINF